MLCYFLAFPTRFDTLPFGCAPAKKPETIVNMNVKSAVFRLHVWIFVAIYLLGFLAPWERLFHNYRSGTLWLAASTLAARTGLGGPGGFDPSGHPGRSWRMPGRGTSARMGRGRPIPAHAESALSGERFVRARRIDSDAAQRGLLFPAGRLPLRMVFCFRRRELSCIRGAAPLAAGCPHADFLCWLCVMLCCFSLALRHMDSDQVPHCLLRALDHRAGVPGSFHFSAGLRMGGKKKLEGWAWPSPPVSFTIFVFCHSR